ERADSVLLDSVPERITEKNDDTLKPQPKATAPTRSQQDYFWRQQEKMMDAGESPYIEPRTEFQLVSPSKNENTGLQLPVRPLVQVNTDWLTFLLLVALALFASVRTAW